MTAVKYGLHAGICEVRAAQPEEEAKFRRHRAASMNEILTGTVIMVGDIKHNNGGRTLKRQVG